MFQNANSAGAVNLNPISTLMQPVSLNAQNIKIVDSKLSKIAQWALSCT